MKVLVIDAATVVRSRLVALLEEHGVEVIGQASSASHARMLCRVNTVDAVILDVDLPDQSGLALISDLRTIAPAMLLVVLTNAMAYRRSCLLLGANEFLDKSAEFDVVPETLTRLSRERPDRQGDCRAARSRRP